MKACVCRVYAAANPRLGQVKTRAAGTQIISKSSDDHKVNNK
jgi:hypothetical protein